MATMELDMQSVDPWCEEMPTSATKKSTPGCKYRSKRQLPEVQYVEDPKNLLLPRIKMSSSQSERQMVDRLYHPLPSYARKSNAEEILAQAKKAEYMPLGHGRYPKLHGDQLQRNVDRFYTTAVEKLQKAREEAVAKHAPEDRNPHVLSTEEIEESVDRLYNSDMEWRRGRKEELQAKYYPANEEPPQLEYSEMLESAQRMFGEMEQRKQKVAALESKYSFEPKKYKKLSAEDMKVLADRLYKPKSGSRS